MSYAYTNKRTLLIHISDNESVIIHCQQNSLLYPNKKLIITIELKKKNQNYMRLCSNVITINHNENNNTI